MGQQLLISGVTLGNSLRFGVSKFKNQLQVIAPIGIAPPNMGLFNIRVVEDALSFNFALNYTSPIGTSTSFGFADYTQYIAPVGGINSLKVSQPTVTNLRKAIYLMGGIPPPSFTNGTRFTLSQDYVANFIGDYQPPTDRVLLFNFGGALVISTPSIGDSAKAGTPSIENTAQSIRAPAGFDFYKFGQPPLIHFADTTGVQHLKFVTTYNVPIPTATSFVFGGGAVTVAPVGVGDTLKFGKPTIKTTAQTIRMTKGIDANSISKGNRLSIPTDIAYTFYQTYNAPNGLNAPFYFWGQRLVYVQAIAPPPMGNAWFSHRVRTISASSIGDISRVGAFSIYTPQIYTHSTSYGYAFGNTTSFEVSRGTGGANLGYIADMFF